MASEKTVTLSDGLVTLEPTTVAQPAHRRSISWRAVRATNGSELGILTLIPESSGESTDRARIEIGVAANADTSTIHALAQSLQLVCRWAFNTLKPAAITWLGPTDPTVRAVVYQAGFLVHPMPQRAALSAPGGVADAWYADLTPGDTTGPRQPPLTAREHHVLAGMARGRSNQQIATDLGISENTVKNHVRSVLEVLHAPSRTAAVIEAIRLGLVSIEFHNRP